MGIYQLEQKFLQTWEILGPQFLVNTGTSIFGELQMAPLTPTLNLPKHCFGTGFSNRGPPVLYWFIDTSTYK
jgi:hypothetical protein